MGFEAVDGRQSGGNGLLPSDVHLGGCNGFLHTDSLSRLPRLVGVLGNSVTLMNPHPRLMESVAFVATRRHEHRGMEPKLAKLTRIGNEGGVA